MKCELCDNDLCLKPFVHGKTLSSAQGGWALMCLACYERYGVKPLGPGRGQLFNARGEKVES